MDEIPETYKLETIEQMRGIADPLRIRIYEALIQQPMTATQVGDAVSTAAPKAHYHVRELERLGLVRLVETRERGGILEKYYRAVARNIEAPPQLLQSAKPDEVAAAISELFQNLGRSVLTAMGRVSEQGAESFDGWQVGLRGSTAWMTADEVNQALKAMEDLLKPYQTRRGLPGEHEMRFNSIHFDAQLAQPSESAADVESPATTAPTNATNATPRPKVRSVWVVGMLTYTRAELEEVIAAHEQLDITSTGVLTFANDVSVDVVTRAVARLRYRGVLSAPSDVRAALKLKEF